jgi:endoglucanase/cellulose 1,4-beta-cellobiosidase
MPSRGLLGTLIVTAATAAVALVAVDSAAGSTAPALAPPPGTPAASVSSAPPTTVPTPDTSPYPPSAPTDLVATRVTSTSVTLSWTAAARGCCAIAGYDVTYVEAFNDIFWAVPVGDVTTTTITGSIRPGGQYSFRVSARDVLGKRSPTSNEVTVVTPIADTGPDQVPPAAPTGLSVGAVSPAGVPLSWSPSTDDVGVTGYNVYWFDGWFASRLLATVTGTSYTAPAPSSARNYYYVRARDAAGNVSIATPAVPVTGGTTPPSSPPVPPTCRVTYTPTADWRTGFTADVTVANTGTEPVDGWTLAFTFGGDQQIAASWNSTFTQAGAAVTMTNAHWNGTLAPGGSTTIGMRGTWSAANTAPAAFTLNGRPCTAG